MGRAEPGRATVHDLDDRGRMRRVLRVEERHAHGTAGLDGSRSGSLVVRSDRRMLTLGPVPCPAGTPRSRRIVALSDGDRLASEPGMGAAARWSLRSAEAWVAGTVSEKGTELLSDVTALLQAAGFDGAGAEAAAAFAMLSYVYPAVPSLPLLAIIAPSTRARLQAGRVLADLCHGGRLAGATRAKALGRLADETGGTLVLHDPGPLEGPSGLTEIGRFVLSSLSGGQSAEHTVVDGGVRTLRLFGPRVVCVARPLALDWPDLVSVAISPGSAADPRIRVTQELLDRLHVWSMQEVGRFVEAASHLGDGIAALGILAPGSSRVSASIEHEPDVGSSSPADLLEKAFNAVRATAGRKISIVELTLEAALAGGEGDAFTPERIGRWLAGSGAVDLAAGVERRRLFGHITRLYLLAGSSRAAQGPADPLDFCRRQRCGECRFEAPCGRLFPELGAARRLAD